jgi:hypothetical protein
MYIVTAVTNLFCVQLISIIIMLWQIISYMISILIVLITILVDYGFIDYDYIVSHMTRITA